MSLFLKRSVADIYPPRIACFVCGMEGPADYPLFLSPHGTSADNKLLPHFPFLRELVPPLGCRPPTPDSTSSSCRSCYLTLMKQWDDNEKGGVPLENRVYWTKRLDDLPVLLPEQQLAVNMEEMSRFPGLVNLSSKPDYSAPHSKPLWTADGALPSESTTIVSNPGWKKMGPPSSTPIVNIDHSQDDNDSALDLSSGSRDRETMKSRSSVISHMSTTSHHSSYQSEGAGSSNDILDLTLPDKNATMEICYVCGDDYKKGFLQYASTRSVGKQPFYPSLVFHPRPPRSRPLDSAGRVQCCDECVVYLFQQWTRFEEQSVPHTDRNYLLRKRVTNIVDTATFVCYICALDYHSSYLRLLYCRSNSENEPYYPMIEQTKPPPGASPISSGGMVQICSHCYKCTREKQSGIKMHAFEPPLKKRKSSRASVEILCDPDQPEDDDKNIPSDIECLLCQRKFTIHSFKFIHSQGPPFGGIPFFPFLKTLPRSGDELGFPCDDDSQGRIRACQTCTTSLFNQWTTFQKDAVPLDERIYSYQSLVGPQSSGRVTPGDTLLSRATPTPTSGRSLGSNNGGGGGGANMPLLQSNPIKMENVRPRSINPSQYSDNTPLKVTVTEPTIRVRLNLETRVRTTSSSFSNPHSPRIPSQPPTCHSPISTHSTASADPNHKPSTSSFYCFLCGLHSELSFARILYSQPQGKKAPYFSFLKEHVPKPRAETMREDGSCLVCTFCYHSVMVQWSRFQDSRTPVPYHLRIFNIKDYVCFVCSVKTYRKRIRALRVMDFPFLKTHRAHRGTLMMENGDMAAVCLDCFNSLKSQFHEAAKYGVPLESRKYNWMVVPPPPENSASLVTPKERLDQLSNH